MKPNYDDKIDLSWLRTTFDCGDNSCLYKPKDAGGMRTNGGCRCFSVGDKITTKKRIFIERMLWALQKALAGSVLTEAEKDQL